MTSHLRAVCFDANDPSRLARFWAELLNWEMVDDPRGAGLRPTDDTGFRIRFLLTRSPKRKQNRMHFDLTSTSLTDQRRTVARSLELGARPTDVGQRPEQSHVVLADPEGNEFCVIEPGNSFLAGGGFVGALACDGSQAVGYFWSKALAWPLVWDQDQETAIRSPHGGPRITWGGETPTPRTGRDRIHFELAPPDDGELQREVDRLVSLGATLIDDGAGDDDTGQSFTTGQVVSAGRVVRAGRVVMADPDGNEFWVTPADDRSSVGPER